MILLRCTAPSPIPNVEGVTPPPPPAEDVGRPLPDAPTCIPGEVYEVADADRATELVGLGVFEILEGSDQ